MNLKKFNKFTLYNADGDDEDSNYLKDKLSMNEIKSKENRVEFYSEKIVNNIDTDDEIVIKLRPVNFCEPIHKIDEQKIKIYPKINELCENDHERIGQLITEIVRYKDMYTKKDEEFRILSDENNRKNEKIIQLEQDLSAFKLGCKAKDNDIKFLVDAHKIKENSLKKQILDFQRTIMTITKEKLNLEIDLQRLKKQNEYLKNDYRVLEEVKREIHRKYALAKDRLKMSLNFINKKKENIIDGHNEKCKKTDVKNENQQGSKTAVKSPILMQDQNNAEITSQKESIFKDDTLISELFFIPTQQIFPDLKIFSDLF